MSRKGSCQGNVPTKLRVSLKVGQLRGMRFETWRQAMDEVTGRRRTATTEGLLAR